MSSPAPAPAPASPRLRDRPARARRRAFLALALCVSALVGAPVLIHAGNVVSAPGAEADPATWRAAGGPGADAYTVSDLEWNDAARGRRVPVRVFWPAHAAGSKVPLVVFSHGIGSARDGYGYLGRYWAEHGIASIHVEHVGSDRSLWKGSAWSLVSRFQAAAADTEALARVADLRFALDTFLASPVGADVDATRITAAGHSYGANTTLLSIGARVARGAQVYALRDPRYSAAIVISAPPFYGEPDFAPILSGIQVPTLQVTTVDDVIRIPGFGSGPDDRRRVFAATGGDKRLAVFNEGSHNVFTEQRHFDSVAVAGAVKEATEGLTLAFLRGGTAGASAIEQWRGAHRALLADFAHVPARAGHVLALQAGHAGDQGAGVGAGPGRHTGTQTGTSR